MWRQLLLIWIVYGDSEEVLITRDRWRSWTSYRQVNHMCYASLLERNRLTNVSTLRMRNSLVSHKHTRICSVSRASCWLPRYIKGKICVGPSGVDCKLIEERHGCEMLADKRLIAQTPLECSLSHCCGNCSRKFWNPPETTHFSHDPKVIWFKKNNTWYFKRHNMLLEASKQYLEAG